MIYTHVLNRGGRGVRSATNNDPALAATVRPLLERTLGAGNVKIVEPSMAGDVRLP